jgi:hypothetical protein
MRIGTLLAVVMGAAMVGCSTLPDKEGIAVGNPPPFFAPTQHCRQGNCYVSVNVSNCVVDVPSTKLNLGGPGGGRQRFVAWQITDSDYEFSTDPNRPALIVKGSGAFFGNPQVNGPIMSTRVNVNTQGASHEYGLTLVKKDGTVCPPYDPWMIE